MKQQCYTDSSRVLFWCVISDLKCAEEQEWRKKRESRFESAASLEIRWHSVSSVIFQVGVVPVR